MEKYEIKYKEALERARTWKEKSGMPENKQSILDDIFPELKESIKESNIKNLIDELKCSLRAANCQNDATRGGHENRIALLKWGIEWLEKQSEEIKSKSETVSTEQNEINDNILSRFAFYLYDDDTLYLSSVFVEECNRKHGYGTKILKAAEEVAKTFGIPKIRLKVETNTWMEEWYKRNGYVYLTRDGKYDWLEKQSEQNKQNFWEKCNHCEYFDGYDLCLHKKNFGSVTNESKENCKNNKFFIEKQCEQKQHLELKDGYDTKFKVGDWVLLEDSLSTYKIVEVCKSWYEVISNNDGMQYSIGFDEEDDCRLWTIDDTKNGDVLATKKGNPFIYDKNRYNNRLAYYYAAIDANEELTLKNPHNMLSHFGELRNVFPATKEQRDRLFKKMKEAGYKWDNIKKELVKQ